MIIVLPNKAQIPKVFIVVIISIESTADNVHTITIVCLSDVRVQSTALLLVGSSLD
jgi:hypothetical protein